jgi:hypothetical protein
MQEYDLDQRMQNRFPSKLSRNGMRDTKEIVVAKHQMILKRDSCF